MRRPRHVELRRLPRGFLLAAAIVPIVLLAGWGGLLLARSLPPGGASIGATAPDFSLADLDGNPLRLEDLRGRPVIVNFWASWCVPCVEEFPLLRSAAEHHASHGVTVVGIVLEDRSESAREFMDRMNAGWRTAMDPGGRVAAAYGVFGPPSTFFIGRDGRIVDRQIGQLTASSLNEKLAAIVDED